MKDIIAKPYRILWAVFTPEYPDGLVGVASTRAGAIRQAECHWYKQTWEDKQREGWRVVKYMPYLKPKSRKP